MALALAFALASSIRKVIKIYHESPHEMQTEMSRGPLAEDEHSTHPPNQKEKGGWWLMDILLKE